MATKAREAGLDRANWPIAAAMLGYPNVLADGTSVHDQPAQGWAQTLEEVVDSGFDCVDPYDSWLRLADLPPERLREFAGVLVARPARARGVDCSRRRWPSTRRAWRARRRSTPS